METKRQRHVSHHVRKVFKRSHDPLWQLQLGIIAVLVLQALTNDSFLPFPKLPIIIVEAVLLLALIFVTSEGYQLVSRVRRRLAIILILVIAAINVFSLIFLIHALVFTDSNIGGRELLLNGLTIYVTNVLMFALLYWEMDGGGPDGRVAHTRKRDFMFTQMSNPQFANFSNGLWLPGYVDYLYVSIMAVTFTSAETPLTHRSKLLMILQSMVSIVTVVLVLAKAVSVLH
jgi:hypothetical protein